jgi:hypothetical protein
VISLTNTFICGKCRGYYICSLICQKYNHTLDSIPSCICNNCTSLSKRDKEVCKVKVASDKEITVFLL